ncbi:hypothetical protein [Brevibacterium moorei]|uniref:hypothetical protein n=1 Tax=Brevibacterium moorei TaxID=2968457 RepID=UPI00211BF2B1|nr:hypothetical protein [Brevibacterium sp. 68QC2CO]MCQ9384461.1 hypothetical protein [Brevibacterium sp. 68QC2CO]
MPSDFGLSHADPFLLGIAAVVLAVAFVLSQRGKIDAERRKKAEAENKELNGKLESLQDEMAEMREHFDQQLEDLRTKFLKQLDEAREENLALRAEKYDILQVLAEHGIDYP